MNRKTVKRFFSVIIVLIGFLALAAVLFGQNLFMRYEKQEAAVSLLPDSTFTREAAEKKKECLVFTDGESAISKQIMDDFPRMLSEMKVAADFQDIREGTGLQDYQTVVLAFENYSAAGDLMIRLMDWVKEGGNLMVACPPVENPAFSAVSRQMGIQDYIGEYYRVKGIRLLNDLMLHGSNLDYMIEEPFESSLFVWLDDDCRVYLASADDSEIPLLWEKEQGEGKIIFDNLGIFAKAYRGFHAAAYSLAGDSCVYPVVNGSMFYIDDFPSPAPGGTNYYIDRDYGIQTSDFYSNIWWPDMLEMGKKHGVRYTGVLIETYDDSTKPPFSDLEGAGRYRYFGNMLLKNEGEIGIHGYNHQPLVKEGFEKEFKGTISENQDYQKEFDYHYWRNDADIAAGLTEVNRFCGSMFPKETMQVYVPPSNIMSKDGRAALLSTLPNIRTIASSYFTEYFTYQQEFEVAPDGVVETPRIISGAVIDDYMKLSAVSELNFHFVNSHFIHPDDILDPDRGAELGWENLKHNLENYMDWLYGAAPEIRNLTGSEAAAAVQRFYYIDLNKTQTENLLTLELQNFVDEAWFFVRFNDWEPEDAAACVKGGTLSRLQGNLYLLKAESAHVEISREVN